GNHVRSVQPDDADFQLRLSGCGGGECECCEGDGQEEGSFHGGTLVRAWRKEAVRLMSSWSRQIASHWPAWRSGHVLDRFCRGELRFKDCLPVPSLPAT